jgi:predicted GH43/DUF377 family glycosyl hydrolase
MQLKRYGGNPIVTPGKWAWRNIVTFNPGVVLDEAGTFWMLERACSNLQPLLCQFGLLKSADGMHFEHAVEHPVFSAAALGTPRGTVEDARVVRVGGTYYMTYVHRNYASSCFPTGAGVPNYHNPVDVPPGDRNNYRTGMAVSKDLVHWDDLGLITPPEIDDRDCVLFPDKIGGRWAMLRRPMNYVGAAYGCDRPGIWLSYSDDLRTWTEPELVAAPSAAAWESRKIGAGAPPLRTEKGWLCFYHGVDDRVTYRAGVMLLDLKDPSRVIARGDGFLLEPREYYERTGLVIPNVVFPSASVVKDGTVFVYYGCCDTCVSVATVELSELLAYVLRYRL